MSLCYVRFVLDFCHTSLPIPISACHAVPSTSGVNEILQNLSRAQLTPNHASRLECRAVVGYFGTIGMKLDIIIIV